jgi:8-oxo-dGTP pyrophosphatase MutT (NUDIX family)
MLGLLAWFGGELIWAGHQVGLAERALAGVQALWPLAVVLTCTGSGRFRVWAGEALPSRPVEPHSAESALAVLLDRYRPGDGTEIADVRRLRALVEATDDPWRRELPLHVTGSVLIAHPPTARVLLRWHQRQQAWLQVGGHGDPGESDPLAIATREAQEETGLADLEPWPDAQIRHVVIVGVPAGKGEPAHQHADVRFFMATQTPESVRAENAEAPLRWLSLAEAREATSEPNLIQTLARMERLLTP